ncbi:exosortase/archaeosortase family protein [bacterium]|nr:exosortase/archaeosortase family protein [bacterium]
MITLRHTVLGIEDGGTGIRSLHLCLAAALFWGELHRLPVLRRAAYLFLVAVVAVVMNSIRSVSLAMLAEHGERDLFDRYHQLAGSIAQILTLTLVLCVVLKCRDGVARKPRPASRDFCWPQMPPVQLHGWLFGGLAVVLLMMEGARVVWFSRGSVPAKIDEWTFQSPTDELVYRTVPFPKRWARQMGADFTHSIEWRGPEESHRVAHYIQWSSENPAALTVRGHQPEICLEGAGFELQGGPLFQNFRVGESNYEFRRYQFVRQGTDVIVYFGVWSSDGRKGALREGSSVYRRERLMRAWRGEGNQGRRLIEVGFWDTSLEAADREMAAFVRRTIHPAHRQPSNGATYATR